MIFICLDVAKLSRIQNGIITVSFRYLFHKMIKLFASPYKKIESLEFVQKINSVQFSN